MGGLRAILALLLVAATVGSSATWFGAAASADATTGAAMLGFHNELRASVGAPAARADARVQAAAQRHAEYLALNSASGHSEVSGAPGFTGSTVRDRLAAQGYYATFVSEVAAGYASAESAQLELWAAPYHRLGMMHPHNVVAGWGHASYGGREQSVGDFVYDFSSPSPAVVRSPAAGQTGSAASWNGNESPSPLPAGAPRPVGYPIMSIYSNARMVVLRAAAVVRASDGAAVPLYFPPQLYEYDYAVVIPQRPLERATTYRVRFDLTVGGQPIVDTWSFTTSVDGALRLTSLHSVWVGQVDPPPLAPGEIGTVQLRFRNTGTEIWQRGVDGKQVNLGVRNDSTWFADNGFAVGWPSANRVATTDEASVVPGQVGTFTFRVRAPPAPGAYRLQLRPVVDGVAWLEDQGVYVPIVVDLGYHSAWFEQSAYPTLRVGELSPLLVVRFRNTGRRSWVRGILGQQANLGVVGDDERWGSLGVGWLSANRVATTQEASVAPGDIATFAFRLRAPSQPGVYDIRLRPVIDGTTWMEDQGVYVRLVVTP